MLVWRTQSGGVPAVPACLSDWVPRAGATLVHRDLEGGQHVVGIGDPLVWAMPGKWRDVGDGWSVALVPGSPLVPTLFARDQGWCDAAQVQDMRKRTWLAPIIRRPGGGRAFRVAYGSNWLPELTPEQERAEEICRAAVDAINQDTPMSVACQWAAELLCMTHHATPPALAGLIDDVLAVEVLRASASLIVEKADAV